MAGLGKLPAWALAFSALLDRNALSDGEVGKVVEIFPESSGIAVGILKTSLGAGGALAPAIFFGLWGQRPPENVLGMKLFPGFANICLAIAVIALTCSVDAQPGCSPHEGHS